MKVIQRIIYTGFAAVALASAATPAFPHALTPSSVAVVRAVDFQDDHNLGRVMGLVETAQETRDITFFQRR